jgi:hypothetical protein
LTLGTGLAPVTQVRKFPGGPRGRRSNAAARGRLRLHGNANDGRHLRRQLQLCPFCLGCPALLDVIAITGPIYLAIAIGHAATHAGLFAKADMQVLGKFVINVAPPALIFRALSTRPIAEVFNPGFLVAYALGSLTLMIAAGL